MFNFGKESLLLGLGHVKQQVGWLSAQQVIKPSFAFLHSKKNQKQSDKTIKADIVYSIAGQNAQPTSLFIFSRQLNLYFY